MATAATNEEAHASSTTWVPPTGNSSQFGQPRPVTITAAADDSDGQRDSGNPNVASIKANHGASIPDLQAIGPDSTSLSEWQRKNNISRRDQIQLHKLTHMRYQHPDLETITQFLLDFGMTVARSAPDEIWFRGYGPDPYVYYARRGEKRFMGGTFVVADKADFDRAASLPSATGPPIEQDSAPGGGILLTLLDPEGFPINLIYGQEETAAKPNENVEDTQPAELLLNDEKNKPRVRKFHRSTPGPAAVHKLGHYGLCVKDFDAVTEWYTRTFNFAPTDFLYIPMPDDSGSETEKGGVVVKVPSRKDVALFAHIDRGDEPVDHHTFFVSRNPTSHVHHASFEVHDFDTQQLGHQWLGKRGYTSVWGIGRHILGSQIFDYWWDTTGNMIEHYADGDLVTDQTPIGWSQAGSESLAVWGPEVPKWFLD